ncbi:MAG: T9SS type A sorting domain-containing protein [Flavobacteriaceae bacterium]
MVILLVSIYPIFSQNTFVGDVVLISQTDVDDFASNNYDSIDGNLAVPFFSDVSDLSGLISIKSVTGSVVIWNEPQITSLQGLNNLETIGGEFKISDLSIVDFDELSSLKEIGGNLTISNNSVLSHIDGLKNLDRINGYLEINKNALLVSINGLESLDHIGIGDGATADCGGPNNQVSNASIIITCNPALQECCLLNRVINSVTGVVEIANNSTNCNSIDEVESLVSNCAVNIDYPRGQDVYVDGDDIRIQFHSIPIFSDTEFSLEFSIDNGSTWEMSSSTNIVASNENNDYVGFYWKSSLQLTEPISIRVRVSANLGSYSILEETSNFTIQPSNYYESLGFRDVGVSQIEFPFNGTWGEIISSGSLLDDILSAPNFTHNCLDKNSKDYYDSDSWHSNSCNRVFNSPIDGTVIFVDRSYSATCSYETADGATNGYGNQIIIQSSVDSTFAFRIAHLNSITSTIQIGSNVTVGQEIGTTGATSNKVYAHAHCSLYKNIYTWLTDDVDSPNSIIDLLSIGGSLVNISDQSTCDFIEERNSAEFSFVNGNIDNNSYTGSLVIESLDNLQDFLTNAYTDIIGVLTIGSSDSNRSINSSNIISLEELSSLRVVNGDLIIQNVDITSLGGLENLVFITGDLTIEDNLNLDDFCALKVLLENNGIGGNIIINGNLQNPQNFDEVLALSNCNNTLSTVQVEKEPFYYPNPTSSILTIEGLKDSLEIEIYNSNHQKIYYQNIFFDNKIDMSSLSSGLYYIILKDKNREKRIVKAIKI